MNELDTSVASLGVAIVEDDRAVREGLSLLIDGTAGYRCVGRWDSVEAALGQLGGETPQVLLLDVHLPGMLGSEGVRPLLDRFPDVTILMLTVYINTVRNYVRSVYEKLHVHSKSEAVSKALRARLL